MMIVCLVFILVLYFRGLFIVMNLFIVKVVKFSNEVVYEINMMIFFVWFWGRLLLKVLMFNDCDFWIWYFIDRGSL